MSINIEFISAGAGSGKTYSLTERLKDELKAGGLNPAGVIATTFTRRAANELKERVREALMDAGMIPVANQMSQSLISTVNGVCGLLLERFSFEAGYSPDLNVLDESQEKRLFNEAVDQVLGDDHATIQKLNAMSFRLGIEDKGQPLWREQLAGVVSAARANNCSPADLPGFADASSAELLSHFRTPVDRDLDQQLVRAAEQALREMQSIPDTTGTTKEYVRLLRRTVQLAAKGELPWPEWIGLSKKAPGAKSRLAAEPVQIVASDYEVHSRLQADIRDYTKSLFVLAADCLKSYQELKQRQGLIDFVDQELLVYRLLDHPTVKETLRDELQLLMVDEFQDTSPIQLALFTRLAALADKVIWVGDIKQAIYGFRGSDPELMHAVVEQVSRQGGETKVLEKSWRSRPALVEYCNAIFSQAFANTLPAEKVVLSPARDELLPDAPAVIQLKLPKLKGDQLGVIATTIRSLVDDGYQIADKKSKKPRALRYGDIAILCRSHGRLAALAAACAEKGIAVSYQRPGLLATPECVLALSCLRRLLDANDTLASAQIRSLVRGEGVDVWLGERLEFLAQDNNSPEWGEVGDTGLEQLIALAKLRTKAAYLTPLEALSDAIVYANVRDAVVKWGPSPQRARVRLANLDSLLTYAAEYESVCQLKHVAATVPGLLQWLEELRNREDDLQAVTSDDETVQLVTYQSAKGLEWPVVFCHDLDFDLRTRLWGLKAMSVDDKIDAGDPLAGRILRFFPSFFGRNTKDVPVKDRVEASSSGLAAMRSAVEEEKRLQYVAFTRARDLLVLPNAGKADSLLAILSSPWIFPEGTEISLPNGALFPSDCLEAHDSDFDVTETYQPRFFAREVSDDILASRAISPSSVTGREDAQVGQVIELGERLALRSGVEMSDLGSAFHGILAADLNFNEGLSVERAEEILTGFGVQHAVDAAQVLAAGRKLISQLRRTYTVVALHPEFPIQSMNEHGQKVTGFIDLLVETDAGYVIVDHKSAPGVRSQWPDIARKYSGQLDAYKAVIEQLSQRPVLGCWLHLVIGSALLEVA